MGKKSTHRFVAVPRDEESTQSAILPNGNGRFPFAIACSHCWRDSPSIWIRTSPGTIQHISVFAIYGLISLGDSKRLIGTSAKR